MFRASLTARLAEAHAPRVERYRRLVWTVNGWTAGPGGGEGEVTVPARPRRALL
ncbi:hypothetical protein [Streptomyces catenulae]|uniref:Uncharacterized protein n=1 Tax=Streptomyces catenulae TaxID=66875 RepID=A0ABV2YSD1_9ACTN|nr:hypothetical protein [Streptomyces catenulae]